MEWRLFADLAEIVGERQIQTNIDQQVTIKDALDELVEKYPNLGDRILDQNGDLHDHINVLHNGVNVRNDGAQGLQTIVTGDDEIALFPPVSGG